YAHRGRRLRSCVELCAGDVEASHENNAPGREIVDISEVDSCPKPAESVCSPRISDFKIHAIVIDVLDCGLDGDRPVHDPLNVHFDVARVDTGNIGAPLELDDLLIDPSRISDLQLGCEVDVSCSEQTLRHLRLESLDVSGSNEPFAVDALKRHGARLFGSSSEDLFDIVQ